MSPVRSRPTLVQPVTGQQVDPVVLGRFLAKVAIDPDGCWQWQGSVQSHGYGCFALRHDLIVSAHRMAYELFVGPIPEGHELDHTCHGADETCAGGRTCPHRRCCRPDHLEAVTRPQHGARGYRRERKAVA